MNKKSLGTSLAFGLLYSATISAFGDVDIKIVLLALPLIWLSVSDLEGQIIPDLTVLAVAAWGVAARVPILTWDLLVDFCAAAAVLTALWAIGEFYWRRNAREALGIGDAKLLAATVLCVGWEKAMWVTLIAAIGGIALIFLGKLFNARDKPGIPFGPFIGYALFLAVIGVGGL